jgi:hypothetical protein
VTLEQKWTALQAYDKFSTAQQAAVSTEAKLLIGAASEEEQAAAASTAAIEDAVNKVNALTAESTATDIAAALKAYAQLTDDQETEALAQFTDEAKEILGL